MAARHLLCTALVLGAVAVQWPLWFGKGGILRLQELQAELASVQQANDEQRRRNEAAAAEIESLRASGPAVEERARLRLGLTAPGETLFRLVPEGAAAPRPEALPDIDAQGTGPEYFQPRNSGLYQVPGKGSGT